MENRNPFNNILLTIISVFLFIVFVSAGHNKIFIEKRLMPNYTKATDMLEDDLETRKLKRWGRTYQACGYIKEYTENKKLENPVFLFEPNSYYADKKIKFKAPEPVIFYYFTGLNGVWMTTKQTDSVTHLVRISNDKIMIYPLETPEDKKKAFEYYKDYEPVL